MNLTAAAGTGASQQQQFGGLLAGQAIKEQGLTHVFTLTGGHIAPILVGCESVGIRVVDVRDEATTVFAADAWSRLTGVPGVAIVTAGPGLTNTITAVKNAQLAQVPVVIFAGATAMILKGRGSLQDIDQLTLMKSAVKQSWSITSVRDIIPTIRKAFRVAQGEGSSPVPGPVFIETPIEILWPMSIISEQIGIKDTIPPLLPLSKQSIQQRVVAFYLRRHLHNVFDDGFTPVKPLENRVVPPLKVKDADVAKVFQELSSSTSPIILIGSQAIKGGCPSHSSETHCSLLKKALERLGISVFLSGMSRGLLGSQHPLLLRHNRGRILKQASVVLLLGVPADFRLDYGKIVPNSAKFFSVNLCKVTLSKNNDIRNPDMKIHSDPLQFALRLAEMAPVPSAQPSASSLGGSPAWKKFCQEEQQKRESEIDKMANKESSSSTSPAAPSDELRGSVNPLRLCRIIDSLLPENSIIVADGGDFVGTASYTVKPRHALAWLDPGVYGTLGVGGGMALAAKLAFPTETVVLLYGDGSSGWGLVEFDTYVRMKTPIIAIIGNDACWTQMYRDQIRLLKSPVATELAFARYDKVVEGFGAKGILVRSEEEIRPAFLQALEYTKQGFPVCINVLITKSGFREGSISL